MPAMVVPIINYSIMVADVRDDKMMSTTEIRVYSGLVMITVQYTPDSILVGLGLIATRVRSMLRCIYCPYSYLMSQ